GLIADRAEATGKRPARIRKLVVQTSNHLCRPDIVVGERRIAGEAHRLASSPGRIPQIRSYRARAGRRGTAARHDTRPIFAFEQPEPDSGGTGNQTERIGRGGITPLRVRLAWKQGQRQGGQFCSSKYSDCERKDSA